MGKIRRMANEFQGQFQEALREAEMADLKKQADDICTASVTDFTNFDPMADAQKEMEPPSKTPASRPNRRSQRQPPTPPAPRRRAEPEPAPPLPQIDVPLPEPPAPVTE